MKYSFTTITTKGDDSSKREICQIESPTALTVKDVKDKCFEYLKIDSTKWVKDTEEVWAGGGKDQKALDDNFVLDQFGYYIGQYYLTLKAKA